MLFIRSFLIFFFFLRWDFNSRYSPLLIPFYRFYFYIKSG